MVYCIIDDFMFRFIYVFFYYRFGKLFGIFLVVDFGIFFIFFLIKDNIIGLFVYSFIEF